MLLTTKTRRFTPIFFLFAIGIWTSSITTGQVLLSSQAATPGASAPIQAQQEQPNPGQAQPADNDFQMPEQGEIVKAVDIVRDPADVPPPASDRPPQVIKVALMAQELEGKLDATMKTTYLYWTFNGKVPGPLIRVRQGDTVEITLRNEGHLVPHSIDLHAVLGPGGGMGFSEAKQGETKTFSFKAMFPGVFVYHCGTDLAAQHIANGMYGLIVVEPPGGLPHADREFYVMQGEIYTAEDMGSEGHQRMSLPKLLNERPEYMVFNGASGALTNEHAMHAQVGESVRIFFGVGGPNLISSPHIIGQILDRVYAEGSLTSPPLTAVQTTVVPPGGATILEFTPLVTGTYRLVDHALIRVVRGLLGVVEVTGPSHSELYHTGPAQ